MDLRKYKLYILDYDGCLIDSLPMWRDSASSYIKHLGYTPKEDLDERIPIFTDLYCAELIKEEYHLPALDLQDGQSDKRGYQNCYLRQDERG